jgi:hypothetical protein
VVAAEVARLLDTELDALVVCKVGVPWHPELALGAVGGNGVRVRNDDVVLHTGLTEAQLDQAFTAAEGQVARREQILRGGRAPPPPASRGRRRRLATGATALAALSCPGLSATVVVLAVPVAQPTPTLAWPPSTVRALPVLAGSVRRNVVRGLRQVEDDDVGLGTTSPHQAGNCAAHSHVCPERVRDAVHRWL